MIDGKVIFLCQTIQQIQAAISSWEHYPDQAQDLPFDAKQHAADLYPLQELLRHQDIYQDDDLHWRIVKLRNELKNNLLFPPPSLIREFQNLYDQLMCALGRHRFAYIPEAAVPYFENEKLFGEMFCCGSLHCVCFPPDADCRVRYAPDCYSRWCFPQRQ